MRFDEFDTSMRRFEKIGEAQVQPEAYIILRMDGKGFSKFTEKVGFERPFDISMHKAMVAATKAIMTEFDALYGYTESDEISVLLPYNFELYNREVAKLVSISASIVATAFYRQFANNEHVGEFIAFDSRIWASENKARVSDYFRWRQADGIRCALNGAVYWTLRKEMSSGKATSAMKNKGKEWKHEVLHQHGINFNDFESWQKRGTGIVWEEYTKVGFNPKTNEFTETKRRRLTEVSLSEGDVYGKFIYTVMDGALPTDLIQHFNKLSKLEVYHEQE